MLDLTQQDLEARPSGRASCVAECCGRWRAANPEEHLRDQAASVRAEEHAEGWLEVGFDGGAVGVRGHAELGEQCLVELSLERTANAAGLTRGYYQQLERGSSRTGRVANPIIQNLIALAQVLGTTVEELLPSDPPDMTAGR